MSRNDDKRTEQKKNSETYNSVTQKTKPENQNQTYNAKKEGLGPNGKR